MFSLKNEPFYYGLKGKKLAIKITNAHEEKKALANFYTIL